VRKPVSTSHRVYICRLPSFRRYSILPRDREPTYNASIAASLTSGGNNVCKPRKQLLMQLRSDPHAHRFHEPSAALIATRTQHAARGEVLSGVSLRGRSWDVLEWAWDMCKQRRFSLCVGRNRKAQQVLYGAGRRSKRCSRLARAVYCRCIAYL
jgi:hypothetical protein